MIFGSILVNSFLYLLRYSKATVIKKEHVYLEDLRIQYGIVMCTVHTFNRCLLTHTPFVTIVKCVNLYNIFPFLSF